MNSFSRPNGSLRFQELSAAKQPLPSAELDNELNQIVTYLNIYYPQIATNPVVKYFLDATAGNVSQTLPADGEVLIFREDATANTVTINPLVGSDTIMGQSSVELYVQNECLRLLKVGTDWRRIN